MRQTWRDLTFVHWRYDAAVIRPLVPAELVLDTFDGSAWIGLVPFVIASRWLPTFPETNVRTYVRDRNGHAGVWFFSLDAASLAAVIGARAAYALPYFWAKMQVAADGSTVRYRSRRWLGRAAENLMEIAPGEAITAPTELEVFLTARLRLYARRGKRLMLADIEHPAWPLQRARILRLEESLLASAGIPPADGTPVAHFSKEISVGIGRPERATRMLLRS